jgi:hypothetical protein
MIHIRVRLWRCGNEFRISPGYGYGYRSEMSQDVDVPPVSVSASSSSVAALLALLWPSLDPDPLRQVLARSTPGLEIISLVLSHHGDIPEVPLATGSGSSATDDYYLTVAPTCTASHGRVCVSVCGVPSSSQPPEAVA